MITCLGDVFFPEVGQATVRVLRRLGHEITFPEDQTCCGQPMFNSGYADLARDQARYTIETFRDPLPVIVPSGSCAAMIKHEYPHLFEHDPTWRKRAEELASRTFELSDFLVNQLHVLDVGARYEGRVAYHYACHLRALGGTDEIEQLIRHVKGAEYVPIARQDQCCGFGGSFAVRYGQISASMVNDKVSCIEATEADAVVSSDSGCLMNIGGRFRRLGRSIEVMHIAQLLARE